MINRIQSFSLGLMNQVMNLQESLDEPYTLSSESIQVLRSEMDRCCTTILDFFDRLLLELQMEKIRDHPNGIYSIDATKANPQFSPKSGTPRSLSWQSQIGSPVSPMDQPRSPRSPHQFSDGSPSNSGHISASQTEDSRFSVVSGLSESPSNDLMQTTPSQRLIATEEVRRHLEKNERFLARRRQSKVAFQEELQALSSAWSPRPSSDGEGNNDVLGLASTLKLPGFGMNVTDGIEAMKRESTSTSVADGLMLVNESNGLTPSTSTFSAHCVISHDSSFYRYGSFCEGAKLASKGQKFYKVVKRPEVRAVQEFIGRNLLIVHRVAS
jgi:hypothetical protein